MGAILGILSNPFILKLALNLMDYFLSKKQADAETKKALAKVAEFLRTQGVNASKISFEAESQIEAGNDEWDKREKNNVQ